MVNMLNLISWLDWPWKTTLKWPFECPNPSTGSYNTMIFILNSFDLYSHRWLCLTTGFALKNYPEITLCMSKSVHWIQRYSDIHFEVSWFVQSQLIVPHNWIGLEKLPQNNPLKVQIGPTWKWENWLFLVKSGKIDWLWLKVGKLIDFGTMRENCQIFNPTFYGVGS